MDDELILIVVAGIAVILIIVFGNQKNKNTDETELIQDDDVTTDQVLESLENFKPKVVSGRKKGFTEKDVETQLEKYLKNIYQHVTTQHGVEGTNSKAIDFDIGRGRVGIELKLSQEVMKESGNDRLLGQVIKYSSRKYNDDNLIVALAGFKDDLRQTALSDLKDFLDEQKVHFCFLNAGNRNQIKLA